MLKWDKLIARICNLSEGSSIYTITKGIRNLWV